MYKCARQILQCIRVARNGVNAVIVTNGRFVANAYVIYHSADNSNKRFFYVNNLPMNYQCVGVGRFLITLINTCRGALNS